MKCQSFWLFDPSRRSLIGGVGGRRGRRRCRLRERRALPTTRTTARNTLGNRFSIRTRCAGVRRVSRAADPLHDVAEQKNRSGDDDPRRRAPRGGERLADDRLRSRSAARARDARACSASVAGSAERAFDARVTTRWPTAGSSAANMPVDVLVAHRGEHERARRAALRSEGRTRARRRRPGCARRRAAARGRPAAAADRGGPASRGCARPAAIACGGTRDAARVEHARAGAARRRRSRADGRRRRPTVDAVARRVRDRRESSSARRARARPRSMAAAASGSSAPDDDRHARLDDAGLLERDLAQRRAEILLVVEGDRRDRRRRSGDSDVGRVEPAAEADLEHGDVDAGAPEQLERDRGRHLEERRLHVERAVARAARRSRRARRRSAATERVRADRLAVDDEPLA